MNLTDCLQSGDEIALADGQRSLTYSELDAESDKVRNFVLGQKLASRRIGLALDMSIDAVIAVWGILKAGCAYVPMHGELPRKRFETIQSALDLDLVLTAPETDETRQVYPGQSDEAVVFSTSGTSGEPKFIPISHTAARTFVDWAAGLIPLRRAINIAPLTFDLTVFDIFVVARQKGCLYIPAPAQKLLPGKLLAIIEAQQIDTIYTTPSVLVRLSSRLVAIDSLRTIIFAGEPFDTEKFRVIYSPSKTYYNFYGPTETNVCFYHKVENPDYIPIGRPCPYTRFKVEAGELIVKGPNVYLGPDEWYATGDLVEVCGDDLVFKGRKDNQVKRQGYRIDLDEIRQVALMSPDVRDASVRFKDGTIIVQYTGKRTRLRDFIAETLPRYMLPDRCVHKRLLPLSAHGKTN